MSPRILLLCGALALLAGGLAAQGGAESPPTPPAHFHHLHLNTTDPPAAIEFYTSRFDCERARFDGRLDAVWAQKSWLLFNKVKSPPPWELTSAVWHMGWGAEDMKAAYQRQLDLKTKFFAPLTHVPEFGANFYYAYAESPDRALIELNSASHHHFGHLHLFSEDPVGAGEWYMKHLGLARRGRATTPPSREPRFIRGFQIGPAMSLMADNVNIIIYPVQYSKQAYLEHWSNGQTRLGSTKGRVIDHVAFSVDDLAGTLARLKKDGVKVTDPIRPIPGTKVKSAFVEGPDLIRLELVEGHAQKE
jgi:catechol 2,3-dioxygenase-like lactoylglutathione lyase family enzyme